MLSRSLLRSRNHGEDFVHVVVILVLVALLGLVHRVSAARSPSFLVAIGVTS